MKRKAKIACLALTLVLLCGCGDRSLLGLLGIGSAPPHGGGAASSAVSSVGSAVTDTKNAPAPAASPKPAEAQTTASVGGQLTKEGVQVVFPFEIQEPVTLVYTPGSWVNLLNLSFSGAMGLVMTRQGQETPIYEIQRAEGPARLCSFEDTKEPLQLRITPLLGAVTLQNTAGAQKTAPGTQMAYLPASTPLQFLSQHADALGRFQRITVIGGVCWDEAGNLESISENYAPLIAALNQQKEQGEFEVYATVYPLPAVVKAGAAGGSVATKEARGALLESLTAHATALGLDGIDFDWESQRNETEWADFSELLLEGKEVLGKEHLGMSVALYPENVKNLRESARNAPDFLNLMLYDQFDEKGEHASYGMFQRELSAAVALGVERQRLVAGIPTYGRPENGAREWPLYKDAGLLPGQDYKSGVYYNSVQTVRDKVALAAQEQYSGVFLYHLPGGLPTSGEGSLTDALS